MDDLISRAAAIAKVKEARKAARTLTGMDFVMMLEKQPAVDAVPVVRCKDCVDWRQEVNETTHWVCSRISQNHKQIFHTSPDWYCARGKRRESE